MGERPDKKEASTTKEDVETLRKIGERDSDAFAALYNRYAKFIFAFLNRFLKNRVESEDVLQETFWQAWRQAGSYDPSHGSPAAWLCTLARRLATDRFRRFSLRRQRDFMAERLSDAGVADAAQKTTEGIPRWQGVRSPILLGIAKEQQEAILLSFFEGFTYEEIARRLEIPIETVKARIRLGMNSLNVIIQTEGNATL
jgi:RNA polymerase sigma-70 factor (ECF subfamily)